MGPRLPLLLLVGCTFEASLPAADDGSAPDAAPDASPDATPVTCVGYTNGYRTSTTDGDWNTAQETCAASGGYLAVIGDPTENAVVRGLMPTTIRFWLGMSDLATENTWLWLDGSAVPRDAQFWDGGQPNDNQSFGGEDCGEMSNGGTWNDKNCTMVQPYVCECP